MSGSQLVPSSVFSERRKEGIWSGENPRHREGESCSQGHTANTELEPNLGSPDTHLFAFYSAEWHTHSADVQLSKWGEGLGIRQKYWGASEDFRAGGGGGRPDLSFAK